MRPLSRRVFLAKLAASAFLLCGCGPRPPLRVAVHPCVGHEPMFLARSPMHLADLAGARIGVEQSAVGALMLAALLERGGLAADEVQPVSLGFHEHAEDWLGRVFAGGGGEKA